MNPLYWHRLSGRSSGVARHDPRPVRTTTDYQKREYHRHTSSYSHPNLPSASRRWPHTWCRHPVCNSIHYLTQDVSIRQVIDRTGSMLIGIFVLEVLYLGGVCFLKGFVEGWGIDEQGWKLVFWRTHTIVVGKDVEASLTITRLTILIYAILIAGYLTIDFMWKCFSSS